MFIGKKTGGQNQGLVIDAQDTDLRINPLVKCKSKNTFSIWFISRWNMFGGG